MENLQHELEYTLNSATFSSEKIWIKPEIEEHNMSMCTQGNAPDPGFDSVFFAS